MKIFLLVSDTIIKSYNRGEVRTIESGSRMEYLE
jgi:hypothetical protein